MSSVNALNLEPIPILLLISAFHGPLASPIFREHEFRSPDSTNHQGKLQKGKALNHTYLPKSPFFMSVSRSCSRSLSAARGHDLIKTGICVEEIWIDLLSLSKNQPWCQHGANHGANHGAMVPTNFLAISDHFWKKIFFGKQISPLPPSRAPLT